MPNPDPKQLPIPLHADSSTSESMPRSRKDVEFIEQVYNGKPCYVLKDPAALRYYRLRPPEYMIYQRLDGKTPLEQILQELSERFPDEQFDSQTLMNFIIMLRGANLLQTTGDTSTEYLLKRKKMLTRSLFTKLRTEFLFYRIPLFDPDRLLNGLYRVLGPLIFSRQAGWILLVLLLGGAVLCIQNIDKISQAQPLLSWYNLLYLLPGLLLIKFIHEFGHGLTAKHFGSEVHEMGILFLIFSPCFYCDVSDSWMIPEKRKRMWITAAGIAVEVILAILAAYIWALTEPKTVLNQFALNVMLAASVNTLLFNGNPLLRYDGYYFLMDMWEIPNLKQKGSSYLYYFFQRYVLGLEQAHPPLDSQGRTAALLGYAVCSAIYRWFIMFVIIVVVWKFFDPYGFGIIGGFLAVGCIYSSLVMPVFRFLKYLYNQYHFMHIRWMAAGWLLFGIAAGLYFFLAFPVEQTLDAQCVLRPANVYPIYVNQPGFLLAETNPVWVKDGQRVQKDQVLLVLSDPQLEQQMKDLHLQIQQNQIFLDEARQQKDAAKSAQLEAKISGLQAQFDRVKNNVEKLTLRSPLDGIVQRKTPKPLEHLVGSFIPLQTEVFAVYPPDQFEAVAAINHRDFGRVQIDQKANIRLWPLDDRIFESRVPAKPPKPVFRMSSPAFSTAFGGEVPTMPAAEEEQALEPADNTYELELPLQDSALRDGMVGRAEILIEKKPLGKTVYIWLLRTLRQDIRL